MPRKTGLSRKPKRSGRSTVQKNSITFQRIKQARLEREAEAARRAEAGLEPEEDPLALPPPPPPPKPKKKRPKRRGKPPVKYDANLGPCGHVGHGPAELYTEEEAAKVIREYSLQEFPLLERAPADQEEVDKALNEEPQGPMTEDSLAKAKALRRRERKRATHQRSGAAKDAARLIKACGLTAAAEVLKNPTHWSLAVGATAKNRANVFMRPKRSVTAAGQAAQRRISRLSDEIKRQAKKNPIQAAAALGGAVREPEVRMLLPQAGVLLAEKVHVEPEVIVVNADCATIAVDEEEDLAVMAMQELARYESDPDEAKFDMHMAESDPDAAESDPDGVEFDPDSFECDPDSIESDPDDVESDPDDVDSDPDDVDSDPDNVDSDPDDVDSDPDNVDSDPDNVESDPDNVESDPDNVESDPDNVEVDPDNSKAGPEDVKYPIEHFQYQPDVHNAIKSNPDAVKSNPDAIKSNPDAIKTHPEDAESDLDDI